MWAKRVYLIDSARISARLYQPLVRVDIKFIVESLIISWYLSSSCCLSLTHVTTLVYLLHMEIII